MTRRATGLDQRQLVHRKLWEEQESDSHSLSGLSSAAAGKLSRRGHSRHRRRYGSYKESRPDVISADILSFPGIDVVADAHRLPFRNGSLPAWCMLDVLHHLERPIEFLKEASRVLKPGGRLAMIEPAMTTVARAFYDRFHDRAGGHECRRIRACRDQSRPGPV